MIARALVTACSFALVGACSVDLGETPARCSASSTASSSSGAVCPNGYTCIHDVCARPGTHIPTTVSTLQYLRATDLRLVPESNGVLVAWEIYNYDAELHDFAGARVGADGNVSAAMTLVAQYPADSNYLEPYFDVVATTDTELLVTMGAAPVDHLPQSRLTQFAVHLPDPGREAEGATSEQRWELRMPTVGYGAVSEPKLVRTASGISLGYFESIASDTTTEGALATFDLDDRGNRLDPPACTDSTCCQANQCTHARSSGLPIAVSVVDAFPVDGGVAWILDDTRPSFLSETFATLPTFVEGTLDRLAVPVAAAGSNLLVLTPSSRTGAGLPDDPAAGAASLSLVPLDGSGGATQLAELPGVRDTPRPAFVSREGTPSLLITSGLEVVSPKLFVYSVNTATGSTKQLATIDRFSTLPVAAIEATIVGDSLYVVWLEVSSDTATIRASVLAAP